MNKTTKKIVLAAFLLALGLLLPNVFHLFGDSLSRVLSPLHIPAFFAGFLLGGPWGLGIGIALPLLSSFLTGMPVLFPMGISMAVELGLYGLISGVASKKMNLVVSLIIAVIVGRVGFSIVQSLLLGFTSINQWWMLLVGNFTSGIFAIILQLALIPIVTSRIKKVI